jgi:alpha-tubulin suppressor-like RCC1 family protein
MVDELTPAAVSGGHAFATLTAGSNHTCGVTTSGQGYCWGADGGGQLGSGSGGFYQSTPLAVSGGLTFAALTVGDGHTCGLTTSGQAFCWGSGEQGQLGNGTTALSQLTPTAVSSGLTFSALTAGHWHTCGVTTSGKAYCWGSNYSGELGVGTTTLDQSTPVAVSGGHTFTMLVAATGGSQTCGITTSGQALCWGSDLRGQLGLGNLTY